METGFMTFTMLWMISCTIFYFKRLALLEAASKDRDEAASLRAEAQREKDDARRTLDELIEERTLYETRNRQMDYSLRCDN